MRQKKFILGIFLLHILLAPAKAFSQVNLSDSLIAYLPLNGNGQDQSGNNNHATPTGSQTFWGVDRFMNFPGSMRFIGENGQAKMSFGTPLLSNRAEYSVSFWFSLSQGLDAMNIFGQDNLLEVAFYQSPNRLGIYHPTGGTVSINLSSPFYNTWRHVLITGNASEKKIYINGVLANTQTGNYSLANNSNTTNIGGHVTSQTSTAWMRGHIDELRIYSRVLNNDEIAALYNDNQPVLQINSLSNNTFCAGSAISVNFSAGGHILPGNTYSLQMSQPNGTFDNPTVIASIMSNALSGTFNATIPDGAPSGANYRFRVTSNQLSAASTVSAPCTINGILGNIPSSSTYYFIGNVNGHNYYRSTSSSGGGTAHTTALANGGHVATIYDSTVNQLFLFNARDSRIYIGLNDLVQEGVFIWRNEVPLSYVNWAPNQPDNANNNEDYAEIRGDNGLWNDIVNTESKPHFMELSTIGFDRTFCAGSSVALSAKALSGASYTWSGPNGFNSTSQNPVISNAQSTHAGAYTLTYSLGGCSATVSPITLHQAASPLLPGQSTTAPSSLSTGLILHYPMDGNAVDISGGGNNGTISGGVTPTFDRFGNPNAALQFNGTSGHISVPPGVWFSGNAFTVSCWISKISNNSWSRLFDFGNGQVNNNILLALSSAATGRPAAQTYVGNMPGTQVVSPNALPNNQWVLLTYTWANNVGEISVNGDVAAQGVQTPAVNVMRNINYIGRSNWSQDGYAAARFDDFRLYDRKLDISEIQYLFSEQPENLTISLPISPICYGTSAQVAITNSQPGVSYQMRNATTLANVGAAQIGTGDTLFFSTGNLTASTEINFLASMSGTGCNLALPNFMVAVTPIPTAPITQNDTVCNSGNLILTALGVPSGGHYNWYLTGTGGTPIAGLTGGTYSIDTTVTANYYVSISDGNGCESARTPVTGIVLNPLNPPVDIISGLILYYKFDGNLADSSGYGYNASVTGTNTYAQDRNGHPVSAINSTATGSPGNNYLSAGNPVKVQQLTNQVSVSFWMRQTQTWFGSSGTDGQMPLVNKWDGSTGMWIGLHMQNPSNMSNQIRWRINGSTFIESNTNVPVGVWHHVVCTYNGAQLRIYQNGVLTGTLNHTAGIPNTGVNLFLGRQANALSEITYRGDWDQVRIYNRALNPNEIQTLYNNESVAFANTPFCSGEGNLTLTTFNFPNATYSWTGPNGFSSNVQNPPIIAGADSATYSGLYTLEVADANGCISPPQTVDVVIYPIPSVPTTVNDTVCGSGNAILVASGAPAGASYRWYTAATGGSPIAGQTSSTLTLNNVVATTTRFVSIIRNGCESNRVAVTAVYFNNASTNLSLTGNTVCADATVTTITIHASEPGINYQAFFNSNPISSITASSGGDLTIAISTSSLNIGGNTISIKAAQPGCGSFDLTNNALITIYALPVATVTPSGPPSFCAGEDIDLTASSATSYLWSNGQTGQTINVSQSGTYSVTINDANGCTNTSSILTTVANPLPTPNISAAGNTTFCEGENVTLSASGGNSYVWNDNTTLNSIHVIQSGTYYFTAYIGTCSAVSSSIEVTVNSLPQATISANGPLVFCEGGQVELTASTGMGYAWDNSETTQTINVTQSGSYFVTVTDANGCSKVSLPISVAVDDMPSPLISTAGGNAICAGESMDLFAFGGNSYVWSNGSTANSITVAQADTYYFTAYNGTCSVVSPSISITVNSLPNVIANTSATDICQGNQVTLTGSGVSSYLWNNGVVNGVAFAPLGTMIYEVTGTDANGCENTDQVTVMVNPLPNVIAGSNAINNGICIGSDVTLTGNGAQNYVWSNNVTDGMPFSPTATETYTVTGTDANGCENTDHITVTVNLLPNVIANSNSINDQICIGNSVILTGSGAQNYVWNNNVINGTSFSPTTTEAYTVTGTDANGCENTDHITVTVNLLPNVIANSNSINDQICIGGSVTLTGSGTQSYAWNNNVINGTSFSPTTTETYIVTGTDANGCQNTAQITITVNLSPNVTAGSDVANNEICVGSDVTLSGNGANSYIWNNGVVNGIPFSPTATATYQVTGTHTNGCENTAQITITVNNLPDVSVTQNGTVLTAMETPAVYQWINCADNTALANQTSQIYTAATNGNYAVIVTNANGCKDTSACYTINTVGIKEFDALTLQIFPNPSNGIYTLKSDMEFNQAEIKIYSLAGKIISQKTSLSGSQTILDICNQAAGTYILELKNNGNIYRVRLVKD